MLNRELEDTLSQAFQSASTSRHEFLTVEHLLLALIDNRHAFEVLAACGADFDALVNQLHNFLKETTPQLPDNVEASETQPTLGFQRVLQRAVFHVQSSGKTEVTGANVLVAIFSEQESQAVYFLKMQGIERLDVVNFLSHGVSDSESDNEQQSAAADAKDEQKQESALSKYAINLNKQAAVGQIDPLVGRDSEVERVVQILSRRRKNNPLLVGEAGVGKTAIAEGLAKLIIEEQVPDVIANSVVYSLDLGALVAGTKYRGDFEKRLKSLLNEIKDQREAILFIDEIHTIIGAGATSGGSMDASNLLKPLLSSGQLRCIGSTTFQEFRGIFEKDRALARRFQKVDVLEPSVEDTYQILKGLRSRFEEHHEIRYTDAALKSAAEMADRYINEKHLPDKAIDVIDEAGAYQRLIPEEDRVEAIDVPEIETIVAKIARIPPKSVSASDKQQLAKLDTNLKMVVLGQDEAIDNLSAAIKLSRAGLKEPNKPVGSFLFAGPTGVGKTEVTSQLARILGIELIRFDMSEYMERHTVSRLIGAPPGYVGFDQGGLLTEAVTKSPHAVVLLDEIEKAHPEVFNLLLQVMDNGTLTDNNGRKADFRNVILIMTTNAGAEDMGRASFGFAKQDHSSDGMEAIKRLFTPEFRNRLDSIVQFKALTREIVRGVVDKFLMELQVQLDDKKVSIHASDEACDWLAEHGYDEKMGARPMRRLIQEKIKKPLAEKILFGELSEEGGSVEIVVNPEGELDLETSTETKMATV
ncbi:MULTISPECIES: ATP-dependent Clp protease ATP-binding subunit ClpA [unclassified Marinobacterium]|jgi:ATP-dependent Clp protease ATP-binding subunit ClpA|uniref:ATP-dependent Clp protease ATP-binding subunit ClpA n=1 Tax=unclassified Marinobacterium TaxID=2644139 RepID=UPI0015696C4D|nr:MULTISPECIES: ATP-dependent Clp protease ATP-binding subunit ClpA [unclassified Marinobacterium]NRP09983.1 ATP-dependent Clp protease ATP-binding subunit ClpA [Marinobacterium sp. xm-g-48]NRP36425.1 ATP-dependent Clp protease ATP-binding subunit ClpA [Marinobacterium sp. xm-d-579]NRP82827.1 ATP-dependent Clp protease ATP-binding subunit ClpA [Marinobacterium sp. xm-d-509]NRP93942.1 ATP-dependent Clp protease ATP-binding subunit ClpA [Marinobacterium sp. xm-g-59]NRQ02691.1 ATP-dependent Clp 